MQVKVVMADNADVVEQRPVPNTAPVPRVHVVPASVAPAPASSRLTAASQPKISQAILGSVSALYQLRLRLSSQRELQAGQISRIYLLLVVTYYSSYNILVGLISWVAK
jgi:hypothetical protein